MGALAVGMRGWTLIIGAAMRMTWRLLVTAMLAALSRSLRPATAALAASMTDRLGPDRRVRLEALDHGLRDIALEQALDVAQVIALVHAHQRDRLPFLAGAAGAADAMHVILRHVGQFIAHHVRQLVDVQ